MDNANGFRDNKTWIKFERLPADILSKIPNLKRVLLEDENIIFAYLFGGLARGELKPLSDVDISNQIISILLYLKNH